MDGFSATGKGDSAMEQFSMIMGLPILSSSNYSAHINKLAEENKIIKEKVMEEAWEAVRQAHITVNPELIGQEIIDIGVSYDGTWHKRGHTSLYGIGIVIDILTGIVIDFEILSKYCGVCTQKSKSLDKKSKEYKEWLTKHKADGECDYNFTGSSNAMEVAAAEILWKRSVAKCKMRYTTVLSDGDAKTYKHLQDLSVYGPGVSVEKEECINHVAKRLRTGLKNSVAE